MLADQSLTLFPEYAPIDIYVTINLGTINLGGGLIRSFAFVGRGCDSCMQCIDGSMVQHLLTSTDPTQQLNANGVLQMIVSTFTFRKTFGYRTKHARSSLAQVPVSASMVQVWASSCSLSFTASSFALASWASSSFLWAQRGVHARSTYDAEPLTHWHLHRHAPTNRHARWVFGNGWDLCWWESIFSAVALSCAGCAPQPLPRSCPAPTTCQRI